MATKRTGSRGFTLIELMITVAIIGVLAALAYPSYARYIARGKRSAAQSFMHAVQSKQEQFMLNARSYFDIDGTAGKTWADRGITVPQEVLDNYTVTVGLDAGPPPGYTITAAPKTVQQANDASCGTLTLTSLGLKSVSGTASNCW